MSERVSLGLMQIKCGPSKERNLKKISSHLRKLEKNPDIIVTPEYFGGLRNGKITKNLIESNSLSKESDYVTEMKNLAKQMDFQYYSAHTD